MNDADRIKLLHGPYRPPRCRLGGKLFCEVRGWVAVRAISDGPIVWPMTRRKGGGRPFLIVCGDLARAIRRESAISICYWWGVTAYTVTQWRKALEVPEFNEGTRRLYIAYIPERLPPEVQERASAKANSPEANVQKTVAKIGRVPSAKVRAVLVKGRKYCNSPEARRKRSETAKRRRIRPPGVRPWTPEEDALLGRMGDREVARRTGRSLAAVRSRRCGLGLQWQGKGRRQDSETL